MWCERFAAAIAVRNRRMLDRTRDANSIAAYKAAAGDPSAVCSERFAFVWVCVGLCVSDCACVFRFVPWFLFSSTVSVV